MKRISQRIKHYRVKRGLTQEYVANELGIKIPNYVKYESGERTPKDDRLIKIAQILGVSYDALNEGIEQEFVGLLNRHAIGAVLGDIDGFEAFASDMESSAEAYSAVSKFLDGGAMILKESQPDYYHTLIEAPKLISLMGLYNAYKKHLDTVSGHVPDMKSSNGYPCLDVETTIKWAFCIAVRNYLEQNDVAEITSEAKQVSGNMDGFIFFATMVFVPYLSFIIDAVELCTNTVIDDFEIAFLHDALSSEHFENNDISSSFEQLPRFDITWLDITVQDDDPQ